MRTLTRTQLTATLAARQMLLSRQSISPAEAILRLTPLQGQEPHAPFVALAARLEGFSREDLEAAISAREVVKTTIMRETLHLVAAADYPAYAQLSRQSRMRGWRRTYPHLDEAKVVSELRAWLEEPRSNTEIRERVCRYEGVPDDRYRPILLARTLLPLVQLPPAGFWEDPRRPRFVVDPRPLPGPEEAAELVLSRYLAAYGPASRRDVASWAGVAQRDFASALERLPLVSYVDEKGTQLFDLPDQPLPPASTPLPVRFLSQFEQIQLAYEDRDRVMPPEVRALALTVSGARIVTVDGRVAASWSLAREEDTVTVTVTPHVDIPRAAHGEIREEAERAARFCEPSASRYEVLGA